MNPLKLCVYLILLVTGWVQAEDPAISTREDRQALFESLLAKTLQREAISPIKNQRLGLDIERDMRALEAEVVNANSAEALYYALVKLSNVRKDRHLRVSQIKGGLKAGNDYRSRKGGGPPAISLRFAPDFGSDGPFLFVADLGFDISQKAGVTVGDKVIGVNGVSFAQYLARVRPYFAYSTENGFWMALARAFPRKHPTLPPSFYGKQLELALERASGEVYRINASYHDPASIRWSHIGRPTFPGFHRVKQRETFDLYKHRKLPVLVLRWHGFREDLVKDINWLMTYAEKRDLLDHHIIWDGTASRGGSLGAYALQHLTPKPFKTTFGNLRLSDATPSFIAYMERLVKQRKLKNGHLWLMDWLRTDVTHALAAGEAYSNNVPFKLAHLPKDSDGILQPAAVHFSGSLVVLLGPRGGSHLDQFAAMVVDNKLGKAIGMPTGGYSNTWEWYDDVTFPLSGKPVVRFMWSIGHTIRPNGQILEGNPAEVDLFFPQTRTNYVTYHNQLLQLGLDHLFP